MVYVNIKIAIDSPQLLYVLYLFEVGGGGGECGVMLSFLPENIPFLPTETST